MVRQLVDKWALEEGCTSGEAAKLRALASKAKHTICSLQNVLLLAWHVLCKEATDLASALALPEPVPSPTDVPLPTSAKDALPAGNASTSENAALPLNLVASLKAIDDFSTGKPPAAATALSVYNKTDLVGKIVKVVNIGDTPELNGQYGKCLQ